MKKTKYTLLDHSKKIIERPGKLLTDIDPRLSKVDSTGLEYWEVERKGRYSSVIHKAIAVENKERQDYLEVAYSLGGESYILFKDTNILGRIRLSELIRVIKAFDFSMGITTSKVRYNFRKQGVGAFFEILS